MPAYRCLGSMVWPCDHEEKHRTAAHLGWHRRRHGLRVDESGHRALESLGFKRAHTDPSHKGFVRFQEGGKWHELPRAAFNELVNVARAEARDAKREQAQAARSSAKSAKEEARNKKAEEKSHEEDERALRVWEKTHHANVIASIKAAGGIRPDRMPAGSSRRHPPEYEEWRGLPAQVRVHNARNSSKGKPLDEMAAIIHEEHPELPIERGSDLKRYLEDQSIKRRNEAYQRKHRAAPAKPEPEPPKPAPAPEPPKAEPKPEPAKPAPAPNAIGDLEREIDRTEREIEVSRQQHAQAMERGDQTEQKVLEGRLSRLQTDLTRKKETLHRERGGSSDFKYVASQKANGKWIVSRMYKDGRLIQEPKEYASNPIPHSSKKASTQPTRGQANMFGGENERQEISGVGLFD